MHRKKLNRISHSGISKLVTVAFDKSKINGYNNAIFC